MASDRWVVNASPLILLGKVEQLQMLGALAGEIAVPRAVIREVSAKSDGARTVQTLAALTSTIVVDEEVRRRHDIWPRLVKFARILIRPDLHDREAGDHGRRARSAQGLRSAAAGA